MTEQLYRIHWKANKTGATGHGTKQLPRAEAQYYADEMNSDKHNKLFGIVHWIEPVVERPAIVTDEHLEYLDELRESGVTNMLGAGEYLRREFGMDKSEAYAVLSYWMETFSERHENKA